MSVKELLNQNWAFLTDFEHKRKRPFFEKAVIVLAVLAIDLLYVVLMIQFLQWLFSYEIFAKYTFWSWANGQDVINQLHTSITMSIMSLAVSIVFACILAPLWETVAFHWYFPRKKLRNRDEDEILKPEVIAQLGRKPIYPLILFLNIIFGLAHGGPINLLVQGVGGLFLSYVYLRNGRSFWSTAILHALYNGVVIAAVYTGTIKSLVAGITLPYWVLFQ